MKIYSWNLLRDNKKLEDAYQFIESLDFDVLCLQEVTEEMLERIKKMEFQLDYGVDKYLISSAGETVNYNVILSRHPINSSGSIPLPEPTKPLIAKLSEWLLKTLDFYSHWKTPSKPHATYADIQFPDRLVRVFSLHLLLWTPDTRRKEFEEILKHQLSDEGNILCGDLNILEKWPVTLLNFMLGGKMRELFSGKRERATFESLFSKQGLQNPLRGKVTHDYSRSQLDHILVPSTWSVLSAEVLSDAHGSDHQPVFVEAQPA